MKPFLQKSLPLLTIGAFVLTILLLLARFHWLLERFTHFRLPFAIGLLILLTVFLWKKSWVTSLALALCLLLQAIPLSHHYLPFTRDTRPSHGPSLTVLTFNVLTNNPQKKEVLAFLTEQDPDLICLQETSSEWLAALQPLRQRYPHLISHPRSDPFGILLFSKHPITKQLLPSQKRASPYLTATIDWHGTPLNLINAHPLPPIHRDGARSRNDILARIRDDVAISTEAGVPIIAAGDFNCTRYSPEFAPLKESLRDPARGRGYPATWQRGNPLLGIPIDHLLYTSDLVCTHYRIGPRNGSDHSAVIATFRAAGSP